MKKFREYIEEKSKKPTSVKHGECEDCGGDADILTYGDEIDQYGNKRYVTQCKNPRCPSHKKQQSISDFV